MSTLLLASALWALREVVLSGEVGSVYTIDGVGRYGETVIVMAGRYLRVEAAGASARKNPR